MMLSNIDMLKRSYILQGKIDRRCKADMSYWKEWIRSKITESAYRPKLP